MSVGKPKRTNTLWDIEIERTDPLAAGLADFAQHKKALLDNLRRVHGRGPKSEPFDADKSWRDLTRLARFYLGEPKIKSEMTAAQRVERLSDLARALGRARRQVDRALRDDVGSDLLQAWFRGMNMPWASAIVLDADGSSVATRIVDEIEKVATGLATLETAARRAAADVPTRPGRPKRTALPPDYILALANVYRDGTGSEPGAGAGPFSRFVSDFLTALGCNIAAASVVDAIKDTLGRARMRPAASSGGPSPFDE